MTKSQLAMVIAAAAGAIAVAGFAAWPSGPTPQEIARQKAQEKERQELEELISLKGKLDERDGYRRQLRQDSITCKYKSGFDALAAFNSVTPELIESFECAFWNWPVWFPTDPMKSDRQFIYVRLPYRDERWHWAKRSNIANYGQGIPQP